MNQSENVEKLITALAKAKPNIKAAKKDKINPCYKSKYASFTAVCDACIPALTNEGLIITQTLEYSEDRHLLLTKLYHTSGQWISSAASIRPVKDNPQAYGSAITYMKRYALAALVGISAEEDDDGNAASAPDERMGSDIRSERIGREKGEGLIRSERIGREKGEKLEKLLLTCGSSYSEKVWKWAATKVPGLKSLEELPLDLYDRMLKTVLENAEKEKAVLANAEKENEGFEQNGSEF
jgi:hypothetical protein